RTGGAGRAAGPVGARGGRRGRHPQDARADRRRVPLGDGPVRRDAAVGDRPGDDHPQPGSARRTLMSRNRPFLPSATGDFPADLEFGVYPPALIDQMMATLRSIGVRRVNWLDYGSAVDRTSPLYEPILFQRTYGPESLDALGEPLPVAAEAAHRHGL